MKKTIGLVAILVLLLPTLGISGALSFRLAYFIPRAQSDLWTIEFENMSFQKSDFQTTTLGICYEHFLTKELSLVIGVDSYSQTRLGNYKDYVGYSLDEGDFAFPANIYEGAFEITHNFSVYIGGGATLYIWNVKLLGDMVDFTDEWFYEDPDLGDVPIYGVYQTQARAESRFSVGFQGFVGFMIPIASRLAFEAEFKYNVGKGSLGETFEGFDEFDLGGYQISLGVNYWF